MRLTGPLISTLCAFLALCAPTIVSAQCNNTASYGGGVAPASGNTLTISSCQWAEEYAPITGVAALSNYIVTSSVSTDYVTVRQGTSGGIVIANGPQPLSWTSTVPGDYFIHFNMDAACNTQTGCRVTELIAPVAMTHVSTTCTQVATTNITKCSLNDKVIIGVEVVTNGNLSPLNLTQLRLRTTGSTAPLADIGNVDVFYTGNNATFNTATPFGNSAPVAVGTNFFINGSQTLLSGTNYFWVAYDLNAGASIGNSLDARCNQVTITGTNHSPTTNNPVGNGTIAICPPSPGAVDNNILMWLKPDAGVTTSGVNITGWSDQSTASTAITIYGSPDLVSAGRNYNDYVQFTLSNGVDGGDYLKSANLNLQSFFFIGQLTDLTRASTHMVTYDGVTLSAPCSGCALHGGENGGSVAQYHENTYGNSNFDSPGVWRRNGSATGVSYSTPHSGNFDIVSALGTGTGSVNSYLGGQDDNGFAFNGRPRDWYGPVGELVTYSGSITAAEANRIESYLALKYGVTLGGNGSTTVGYTSSSGASIWSAAGAYHNDVIGIGRDDASVLNQKQSHSEDDFTRLYISSLNTTSSGNTGNTGSFISDNDFVMMGRNTGQRCATLVSNAEKPTGAGLYSRLEREWKVQNSNHAGDFNMDVTLDVCAIPAMVNTTHLRLLVDTDGDFSNATVYQSGDFGLDFSYSGGIISVTDIAVNLIPQNSTRYITIASTDVATPLPIELLSFSSACFEESVRLDWTTASEVSNDHFVIERSNDGLSYEPVYTIDGAGNSSSQLSYSWEDYFSSDKTVYYRLKQVDFDGSQSISRTIASNCGSSNEVILYPNPANDFFQFDYFGRSGDEMRVEIRNFAGQLVGVNRYISNETGLSRMKVDTSDLDVGVYAVSFIQNGVVLTKKLSILR